MPKCDLYKVTKQGCSPVNLLHIVRAPSFNSLSANITKSSTTLKQFVSKLPTNCLSVLNNFVGLALTGLKTPLVGCF